MVFRIAFYLVGFGLAVAGGISLITYINFFYIGFDLDEYMSFIAGRIECYLFPAGLIIIWMSIFFPESEDNKEK